MILRFLSIATIASLFPLLLLISSTAADTGVVDQCLVNISLAICTSDVECKSRFYQDVYAPPYSVDLFNVLLHQYLSTRLSELDPAFVVDQIAAGTIVSSGVGAIDAAVQSCRDALSIDSSTSNTTALSTDSIRWWQSILTLADFCTENERFVLEENGCQCQPGKQCQEDPPGYLTFQIASFDFAVALTVVIVLWHNVLLMREVRSLASKITTSVKTLRDTAASNLQQLASISVANRATTTESSTASSSKPSAPQQQQHVHSTSTASSLPAPPSQNFDTAVTVVQPNGVYTIT